MRTVACGERCREGCDRCEQLAEETEEDQLGVILNRIR